ncbi:ribosome small subunit-dependent GTPase A [Alteromonas sediminis]|uniref:Small ribosomal subunit biogenesis GTPase RsgA n=1 Tax=Alteromonas sediminis TaxID=2259342 RepID=A0A3N5YEA4_9ALTE|nr:ribosome small subunit-dependent GTPase A [Alteromonas sediminis]RPJ68005.1 ribosome small subunit-dependent GTPase A [Alteromonas sediminis]
MTNFSILATFGWRPFFQQQLSLDEWETAQPVRVTAQHKSRLVVTSDQGTQTLPITPAMPAITVGDWLLLDDLGTFVRILARQTCFKRKSPGSKVESQLIAANVDVALIVCSLNDDFSLNRIERYLALVHESGAEPVVVLSKADLSDDTVHAIEQVQALSPLLSVISLDCRSSQAREALQDWLIEGKTLAVLGSSGVGKSTLINTLAGDCLQATGSIREDDDKGRHTTTHRALLTMPSGALLLDTPGMRELQLADCDAGLETTFADITALAEHCKFSDCQHQGEPNCAVQAAITSGDIDQRRLDNYLKLRKEEKFNTASLSQRRAADKALGKYYKRTLNAAHTLKGR